MKKIIVPFMVSATMLAQGCQENRFTPLSSQNQSVESKQMDKMMPQSTISSERSQVRQSEDTGQTEMLLAYRYNFSFAIPYKNLEGVANQALKTCQSAGPSRCRIVSSSLNKYQDDMIAASIELRVEPKWFETYRQNLDTQSKAANGKLVNSSTSAEDLTIAISDSSARLGALKTLRTRLLALLETKGSALNDIIQVERELARVQGQIESSTARLRVLKTRVSMSQVHINYETKAVAAGRSSFAPIKQALTSFVGTVAYGFANLIRLIAFILPWFILVLPAAWLFGRWRKKRKARQS